MSGKLFNRTDTILGVCEALGQDFGVHSNWFRAAFGAVVLWQPVYAVAAYLALAVIVLASRLIFPGRSRAVAETAIKAPAAQHEAPDLAKAA